MCEQCPIDGGYCCVCQDTPESWPPMTVEYLDAYGHAAATTGRPLADTIHLTQMERGQLGILALEALIAGWKRGEAEAQQERDRIARAISLSAEELAAIPF